MIIEDNQTAEQYREAAHFWQKRAMDAEQANAALRAKLEEAEKERDQRPAIDPSLCSETRGLLYQFTQALAEKLRAAELKYGFTNGWMMYNWVDSGEIYRETWRHMEKGDPRDVAIYCAFLFWHQKGTADALIPYWASREREKELAIQRDIALAETARLKKQLAGLFDEPVYQNLCRERDEAKAKLATAERELDEAQKDRDFYKQYEAGQGMFSDFRNAKEMREALQQAREEGKRKQDALEMWQWHIDQRTFSPDPEGLEQLSGVHSAAMKGDA